MMKMYGSTLHESAETRKVDNTEKYSTLHVTSVQTEVESKECPGCIETHTEIQEFPEHSTGYGNTWQQTDLHYMVRNGMSLPTVTAYVDVADKTELLSRTKRNLNGLIEAAKSAESSKPVETNETKTNE